MELSDEARARAALWMDYVVRDMEAMGSGQHTPSGPVARADPPRDLAAGRRSAP